MPTTKQRKALKIYSEDVRNDGVLTMGQILKKAGYSESVSLKPTAITKSTGWQALLNAEFPDGELTTIHKELLHCDDKRIKMEALKEAYKLKDRYPATKIKSLEYKKQVNKFVLPEDKRDLKQEVIDNPE